MLRWFRDVKIIPLLIAVAVAVIVFDVLLHGTYCGVPSNFLKPGEPGVGETSVHGVVLYQETGTDHKSLYDLATSWYQWALWAETGAAIVVGAAIYVILRMLLDARSSSSSQENSP